MPGQYWGGEAGRPRRRTTTSTSTSSSWLDARRRMPLAAVQLEQRLPQGRAGAADAEAAAGPGAVLGRDPSLSHRHAYGNATSDDLRQAVLEATGQNLTWFWSQWIYQAGYPEFTVSAAYDSIAGAVSLTVRQTQRDTAGGQGAGASSARRSRSGSARPRGRGREVVIDRREQMVRIDGVRTPPTMVVFDDENAVVKTLDFQQPTPWLATARAEPDLWHRAGPSPSSPPGRPTRSRAPRWPARRAARTTRSPARRRPARSGIPAAVAARVEAAARDTSARVRAAAVSVAPYELAVAGWEKDSSYEVRAAALAAMARLDPARARPAVLTGLRTASYRDAIQNAAIAASRSSPTRSWLPAWRASRVRRSCLRSRWVSSPRGATRRQRPRCRGCWGIGGGGCGSGPRRPPPGRPART